MYLLRCNNCGKIYKIVDIKDCTYLVNSQYLYTDFGDKIYTGDGYMKCLNCGKASEYELIKCEDWVADKVFEVKGG